MRKNTIHFLPTASAKNLRPPTTVGFLSLPSATANLHNITKIFKWQMWQNLYTANKSLIQEKVTKTYSAIESNI